MPALAHVRTQCGRCSTNRITHGIRIAIHWACARLDHSSEVSQRFGALRSEGRRGVKLRVGGGMLQPQSHAHRQACGGEHGASLGMPPRARAWAIGPAPSRPLGAASGAGSPEHSLSPCRGHTYQVVVALPDRKLLGRQRKTRQVAGARGRAGDTSARPRPVQRVPVYLEC